MVDSVPDAMRMIDDWEGNAVVCQPFAAMLQPFEELGVRTVQQGVDALVETARKVRDTSKSYTGEAAQYRAVEGQL